MVENFPLCFFSNVTYNIKRYKLIVKNQAVYHFLSIMCIYIMRVCLLLSFCVKLISKKVL